MAFKFLLPIVVLYFVGCSQVAGQSECGFDGYPDNVVDDIPPVDEGLAQGVNVMRLNMTNVNLTTTVSHNHNKYLTAQRFPTTYQIITSVDFKNFVTVERLDRITRQANLYCNNATGGAVRVTFRINVTDINNQPPVFNDTGYEFDVPWAPNEENIIEFDAPILVQDSDLWLVNARPTFTTNNTLITAEGQLVNEGTFPPYPATYDHTVKLMINANIAGGVHQFQLTASDGENDASVTVQIRLPEEEPTEGPEPSTTQPPECEFVGVTPDVPITTEPIKHDTPVGTEIWRGNFTGGEEVILLPHAHNKYLQGYMDRNEYYLETTADFPNFPTEQPGSEFLIRSIVLRCLVGEAGIPYNFSFPIAVPGV